MYKIFKSSKYFHPLLWVLVLLIAAVVTDKPTLALSPSLNSSSAALLRNQETEYILNNITVDSLDTRLKLTNTDVVKTQERFIDPRLSISRRIYGLLGFSNRKAFDFLPGHPLIQELFYLAIIALVFFLALTWWGHLNYQRHQRRKIASEPGELAMIVKNSSDFIGIINLNYQLIFLNQSGKNLIGFSGENSLTKENLRDYIHPDDRYLFAAKILPTVLKIGDWEGEIRLRHLQTGAVIYTSAYFFLIPEEKTQQPTAIASVIRDITPLKQAQKNIIQTLAQEKAISEMRSHLLTIAAHEIRTPLAIISSSTGILQNFGDRLNTQKTQAHLQTIQQTVQRVTQLLDELMLINRAEAQNMEFQPESGDIIAFCRRLTEEIQTTTSKHRIDFSCSLDQQMSDDFFIVEFDQKLLRHILTNLLTNAIKYSLEHHLVKFSLTQGKQKLIFKISDSGIGIPDADQAKLFTSFHRGSNVGKIAGTGLGLSIVKKCVDLHQGTISVDSQVGKGTTFTVSIPAVFRST